MTPKTHTIAATKFIFIKNPRRVGLVKDRSEGIFRENQGRILEKLRNNIIVTKALSKTFHLEKISRSDILKTFIY